MNQTTVSICGRLVADPEVKQTPKGDVASLRVVVNEWRRDSDGSYVDGPSSFYSVSAWGELGTEVAQCLHKGFRVVVVGTLRVNSYQVEGRNLERVEVRAEHIGPDLRFGTAMYRQRQRSGRGQSSVSSGSSADWAGDRAGTADQSPGGYDAAPSDPTEQSASAGYEILDAAASSQEIEQRMASA